MNRIYFFALLHKSAVVEIVSVLANWFSRAVFIWKYDWLSFSLNVFLHITRIDEGSPILTKSIKAGLSTTDRGWTFSITNRNIASSIFFWVISLIPEFHFCNTHCFLVTLLLESSLYWRLFAILDLTSSNFFK